MHVQIPNRVNVITFMAPFALWNIVLIVIYAISFVQVGVDASASATTCQGR